MPGWISKMDYSYETLERRLILEKLWLLTEQAIKFRFIPGFAQLAS